MEYDMEGLGNSIRLKSLNFINLGFTRMEILECRKLWNSENDRNVYRTDKIVGLRSRSLFDLTMRYLIDHF